MSDSQAEAKIPAPLLALGGWSDAAWFSTSVLSDTEVVGLTFPKLAGLRKQRFDIIDRSCAPAHKSGSPVPAEAPRSLAGRMALIFDSYGATKAVACSRNHLLFESSAILFFAEIPLAKIKQRAANKLRRELIDKGLRCCVVHLDSVTATAMVWPEAEAALTAFIDAAAPDHPIHADFDSPPKRAGAAHAGDAAKQQAREAKLLREVAALRAQIGTLQRAQSALGAMEQLGLDDARLKSMLKLLHPDKHGGSEAANDAAQWLNGLRDLLKGKG